jgi:hypothetical protein
LRRGLPLCAAQENIEAVCALAQDFHILDMQREADEWLTANLKVLSGGNDSWPYRLGDLLEGRGIDCDDEEEEDDDEDYIWTQQYSKTEHLASKFAFLITTKQACLDVILYSCYEGHGSYFEEMREEEALEQALNDAWRQLAALNARGAEPRKDVVRCV